MSKILPTFAPKIAKWVQITLEKTHKSKNFLDFLVLKKRKFTPMKTLAGSKLVKMSRS
jgi:hypothetical protein